MISSVKEHIHASSGFIKEAIVVNLIKWMDKSEVGFDIPYLI